MPVLRPVVSSPLPSEPDLRISPHPALHEQLERSPARAATVVSEVPAPRSGSSAPVFTGGLLPSNRAAGSLDPFALQAAFPPSLVARDCHDYYGSSATPRRQQRTVRLPRTPKGSAGTAGTLPTFTHRPVGRVGAQLYPGGIAAGYRNPPRGLDRPNRKRSAETIPNSNRDRAPQQPIAASFGAAVLYRGF